ncbi:hypothetical protein HO173_007731 [Letharia columbiana]|uniref:Alpha-methylacyl-CoA racemase n=1 Tax=Letharia columbiana TaxID=112416 RepID=A0A8H6FSF2_9LECA|nr:uncharacterized protein HO173_007731 [Letharia columbiana]KAF6233901.1 hypothetical protein HO173_007731 [Letharia columbiana]
MATSPPPLTGLRVIELAGLAPGPFACLLLADYGASVLRIDRAHPQAHTLNPPPPTSDSLSRHKSSIALDLKSPNGLALLRSLLNHADILIDPFRPGVLESIGLHPKDLLIVNPRLIIARLTGFRRDGPYAPMAGHDINYLAVSGLLSQLGRANAPPSFPANIIADFAGGGLMCAFGILAALVSRTQTGKGQIVEANMVDGSAYLGTFSRFLTKTPLGDRPRGENMLDGGCPWYEVYECKNGGYMAVGALEDSFFGEFLKGLNIEQELLATRNDRTTWPTLRKTFRERFLENTRQEWELLFAGKDACCTPVLSQIELEEQGYEQRSAVGLMGSPGLLIPQTEAWSSPNLSPGAGGEEVLKGWTGWKRGKEYQVENGGLVKIEASKL